MLSNRLRAKMEMNDGHAHADAASPLATKRQPLKSIANFNKYPVWKNKLRENCFKRVREDRSRLLWKLRLASAQSKEAINLAFKDIVSDELKKIKYPSLNEDSTASASLAEDKDMLWEYDGLHDAYCVECEEILLEMQRVFYEDLKEESTREEADKYVETWEDEEDEYFARAVFEQMQLNDEKVDKETWCPICKRGQLRENNQHIYCSLCELQLGKDNEVTLDTLQTRLAETIEEHLDRGCRLKPKFCMENRFGLTALYIFCGGCNMFEVVL